MGINIKQFITVLKTGKQAKTPYDEILTMKPFSKMTDSGVDVLQIGKMRTAPLVDDGITFAQKKKAGNLLFKDFSVFVKSLRRNLKEYRLEIPVELYKQLDDAVANNNFALTKIVKDYYAKLHGCKTLEEAGKLYPEFKIAYFEELKNCKTLEEVRTLSPELNEATQTIAIKERIKEYLPRFIVATTKMKPTSQKGQFIDEAFDKIIPTELKEYKIYPEIKNLLEQLKTDILEGRYRSAEIIHRNNEQIKLFSTIFGTDTADTILQIIKQNFGELKSYKDIKIVTQTGTKNAKKFRSQTPYYWPIFDKDLKKMLKNAEIKAEEFKSIAQLDKSIITSAVYTKSWKTSMLKTELGILAKKDGDIFRAVWQKTMFPESSIYPTEKLVDNYLVNLYKTGIRSISNTNPISRFMKDSEMTKDKKMLLQRLYKLTRQSNGDNHILNSQVFQEFKKNFDIEAMTKDIEALEVHYKNYFFKSFWTDFRKKIFSDALSKNFETAKTNIELTDDILIEAMEVILK